MQVHYELQNGIVRLWPHAGDARVGVILRVDEVGLILKDRGVGETTFWPWTTVYFLELMSDD